MNQKFNIKLILPTLLIVSTIFSHLLFLPKIGYKLQITEMVFLISSLLFIYTYGFTLKRKLSGIDKSFIFLGIALILNLLFYPEINVFLNIVGFLYLILLYFLLSGVIIHLEDKERSMILRYSADIGFWILICIGILGFAIYYFWGYSKFVLIYHNYPYFGDVFRIKGFSYSPNLYISLLSLFTILKLSFSKLKYLHIFIVFSLGIISLTKEALLLSAILFAIVLYKSNLYPKIGIISVLLAGFLYIFLSFFIVSNKAVVDLRTQTEKPIFVKGNLKVYPTTYFEVFKSGFKMTYENPIKGVGLGNFRNELQHYQKKGKYPNHFQTYDPLDSYFGIISQIGLVYFFFLSLIIFNTSKLLKRLPYSVKYPFTLFAFYIVFESVALGTYHFRHYYLFFSIISILYLNKYSLPSTNHNHQKKFQI